MSSNLLTIGVLDGFEFTAVFDFLEQAGRLENRLKRVPVSIYDWKEANCDFYFLAQGSVHMVLSDMIRQSTSVRSSGGSDLLVREHGKIWPRNLLGEILPKLIVSTHPSLNTQATAYVAGMGTWGIMSIGALLSMGFDNISWVVEDKSFAEEEIKLLKKNFFSINIALLKSSELILQAHNGSIIINTIPVDMDPEAITDISYYNYLMSNSLVIELMLTPVDKAHLVEAAQVNVKSINGHEVAVFYWNKFVETYVPPKLAKELQIDVKEFEIFLKTRPSPS
jgi:shikimate 5-dehydrogenase